MSGAGHVVLAGPLILAIPVAAAAGAVTFLSPCVLPLVPGYLSFVTGMSGADAQATQSAGGSPDGSPGTPDGSPGSPDGAARTGSAVQAGGRSRTALLPAAARPAPPRPARRRTVAGTALFVLGFSVVFASEGVAFGGLGTVLRTHAAGLTQILGVFTIILGLLFAGVFERFPVTGKIMRPSVRPRAGLAGAPVLGAMFGLSWTPCVGPTLGVVMSLAFTSGTALRGAILMFVYGLGLGIPFLVVALAFQRGVAGLGFARRHARLISRVGGALLVAVGILEVTGAWTAALQWIQLHWILGYTLPL
jgi:cytochrome c-type biogenesis protein